MDWDDRYEYEYKIIKSGPEGVRFTVEKHLKTYTTPLLKYNPPRLNEDVIRIWANEHKRDKQRHLTDVASKKKAWEDRLESSCWLKRLYLNLIDCFCFCCCTRKKCKGAPGLFPCYGLNSWHYR